MTNEQLKEEVLNHWYENYLFALAKDVNGISVTADSCPYCEKYTGYYCQCCPIKEYTFQPDCEETPYYDVVKCINEIDDFKLEIDDLGSKSITKSIAKKYLSLQRAIEKEIAFLESL